MGQKKLLHYSNGFVLLAIMANVVNLGIHWEESIYNAVYAELIGIGTLCTCMVANSYEHYRLSKIISLFAVNGQMFYLCHYLGTSSCNYLYLFPYMISLLFFLRENDYKIYEVLPASATIINLFAILFLCSFKSSVNFPHYHFESHVIINVLINFILIAIFFALVFNNIKKKERKITDAKLKMEQAVKVKSMFLSNMSHELRTPLNGIIGASNLLLQEERYSNNNYVSIINSSSVHMLSLVNQILDYSKLENNSEEIITSEIHLHTELEAIMTSLKVMALEKNVQLDYKLSATTHAHVLTDKLKLTQILFNLLSNAIKFSEHCSVYFTAQDHSNGYQFIITDTGIGISTQDQESIFESFVQLHNKSNNKYGGTGLGLSITKKLVDLLGGTISLAHNQPKGTVFTVWIPMASILKPVQKTPTPILTNFKGLNLLLVEDNPVNLLVAKKMMELWQINVHTAKNGLEGWEAYQQNKYGLLLIDLDMPVMDGKQLMQLIRQQDEDTIAYAFTAAAYDHIYDDIKNAGFNGFIPKPFKPEQLHQTIASAVQKLSH